MTVEEFRVGSEWLDLREPADAAARAHDLVGHLRRHLPATGRRLIHDLACGTGAMGRWLAPLLPGPQRWVLHDRDPDLLEAAAVDLPVASADRAPVAVETRLADITELDTDDLAGATLITASALLDLMTEDELAGLVGVCAEVGCPVLLTLSVTGRVRLAPADPLDASVAAAFDAHQRRVTGPAACSAPTRSRSPKRSSAGWAPMSSSVPALGGCVPLRPTLRRSGSPAGSAPRASRRPSWPPKPEPTRSAGWPRPGLGSSLSPSTTPTCWWCRDRPRPHRLEAGASARRGDGGPGDRRLAARHGPVP